jgi:hypothetical protein
MFVLRDRTLAEGAMKPARKIMLSLAITVVALGVAYAELKGDVLLVTEFGAATETHILHASHAD